MLTFSAINNYFQDTLGDLSEDYYNTILLLVLQIVWVHIKSEGR